jgi:hypothetical protein
LIVEITGVNPPGRRCNPAPEHGPYEDIHVGAGRFSDPVGLFVGDSAYIQWRIEVRVVQKEDGPDFRGPHVDGKRGDRHIYLNWFAREPDGELRLFRRAKVMLEGIDPGLVARAENSGAALRCTVSLTNERGQPTTRRFRAADLSWRLVASRPGS